MAYNGSDKGFDAPFSSTIGYSLNSNRFGNTSHPPSSHNRSKRGFTFDKAQTEFGVDQINGTTSKVPVSQSVQTLYNALKDNIASKVPFTEASIQAMDDAIATVADANGDLFDTLYLQDAANLLADVSNNDNMALTKLGSLVTGDTGTIRTAATEKDLQLSVESFIPYPDAIVDAIRDADQEGSPAAVSTGVLAPLQRVYIAVKETLFLWSASATTSSPVASQLLSYTSAHGPILSVHVATPRAGVFVPAITHIIVVITKTHATLLAVETSYQHDTVHVEITPTDISVATDATVTSVTSFSNGVLLLGGDDGCVYELVYEAPVVQREDLEVFPSLSTSDTPSGKSVGTTSTAAATSAVDTASTKAIPSTTTSISRKRPSLCSLLTAPAPKRSRVLNHSTASFFSRLRYALGGRGPALVQLAVDESRPQCLLYTRDVEGTISVYFVHGVATTVGTNAAVTAPLPISSSPSTSTPSTSLPSTTATSASSFTPTSTSVTPTMSTTIASSTGLIVPLPLAATPPIALSHQGTLTKADLTRSAQAVLRGVDTNFFAQMTVVSLVVLPATDSTDAFAYLITDGGHRIYVRMYASPGASTHTFVVSAARLAAIERSDGVLAPSLRPQHVHACAAQSGVLLLAHDSIWPVDETVPLIDLNVSTEPLAGVAQASTAAQQRLEEKGVRGNILSCFLSLPGDIENDGVAVYNTFTPHTTVGALSTSSSASPLSVAPAVYVAKRFHETVELIRLPSRIIGLPTQALPLTSALSRVYNTLATSASVPAARSILASQHALAPMQIPVLTATGLVTLHRRRPVDIVADVIALSACRPHVDVLSSLVNAYGRTEVAAMCALLACKGVLRASTAGFADEDALAHAATVVLCSRRFLRYERATVRNQLAVKELNSGNASSSASGSAGSNVTTSGAGAGVGSGMGMGIDSMRYPDVAARPAAPASLPTPTVPAGVVIRVPSFSARVDGIALALSRLLLPLWSLPQLIMLPVGLPPSSAAASNEAAAAVKLLPGAPRLRYTAMQLEAIRAPLVSLLALVDSHWKQLSTAVLPSLLPLPTSRFASSSRVTASMVSAQGSSPAAVTFTSGASSIDTPTVFELSGALVVPDAQGKDVVATDVEEVKVGLGGQFISATTLASTLASSTANTNTGMDMGMGVGVGGMTPSTDAPPPVEDPLALLQPVQADAVEVYCAQHRADVKALLHIRSLGRAALHVVNTLLSFSRLAAHLAPTVTCHNGSVAVKPQLSLGFDTVLSFISDNITAALHTTPFSVLVTSGSGRGLVRAFANCLGKCALATGLTLRPHASLATQTNALRAASLTRDLTNLLPARLAPMHLYSGAEASSMTDDLCQYIKGAALIDFEDVLAREMGLFVPASDYLLLKALRVAAGELGAVSVRCGGAARGPAITSTGSDTTPAAGGAGATSTTAPSPLARAANTVTQALSSCLLHSATDTPLLALSALFSQPLATLLGNGRSSTHTSPAETALALLLKAVCFPELDISVLCTLLCRAGMHFLAAAACLWRLQVMWPHIVTHPLLKPTLDAAKIKSSGAAPAPAMSVAVSQPSTMGSVWTPAHYFALAHAWQGLLASLAGEEVQKVYEERASHNTTTPTSPLIAPSTIMTVAASSAATRRLAQTPFLSAIAAVMGSTAPVTPADPSAVLHSVLSLAVQTHCIGLVVPTAQLLVASHSLSLLAPHKDALVEAVLWEGCDKQACYRYYTMHEDWAKAAQVLYRMALENNPEEKKAEEEGDEVALVTYHPSSTTPVASTSTSAASSASSPSSATARSLTLFGESLPTAAPLSHRPRAAPASLQQRVTYLAEAYQLVQKAKADALDVHVTANNSAGNSAAASSVVGVSNMRVSELSQFSAELSTRLHAARFQLELLSSLSAAITMYDGILTTAGPNTAVNVLASVRQSRDRAVALRNNLGKCIVTHWTDAATELALCGLYSEALRVYAEGFTPVRAAACVEELWGLLMQSQVLLASACGKPEEWPGRVLRKVSSTLRQLRGNSSLCPLSHITIKLLECCAAWGGDGLTNASFVVRALVGETEVDGVAQEQTGIAVHELTTVFTQAMNATTEARVAFLLCESVLYLCTLLPSTHHTLDPHTNKIAKAAATSLLADFPFHMMRASGEIPAGELDALMANRRVALENIQRL